MDSDEINQDEIDNDAANQEMLIDIFYKTKGNIDNINNAIDKKLFGNQIRSITLFEKFIKARLDINPKILNLSEKGVRYWLMGICQFQIESPYPCLWSARDIYRDIF